MRTDLTYDDVRLIAAVTTTRSVRGASARLGAHVATVYRRLQALEYASASPLFIRGDGGTMTPSAVALEITEAAQDLHLELARINRRLAARDDRLQGSLSVTTTDSLVPFVCSAIDAFRRTEPDVDVRLVISGAHFDMARNEADIAVRATNTPPETLVGQRVAPFDYVVCGAPDKVDEDRWIALDGVLAGIPAARWVSDHIPSEQVGLRVDAMSGAAEAAAAGLGRALLPRYMLTTHALVRLADPDPPLVSEVWILTHPDLRTSARVRAFMAAAAPHLRKRLSSGI